MIKYVPLPDWAPPVVPLDPPFDKLDAIGWLPLAESELLLSAHYYPIAVRLDGPEPAIGVLLRSDTAARQLVGSNGGWAGAYVPIALRCFPFKMMQQPSGDPLTDLHLAPIKPATEKPRLMRIRDEAGLATKELTAVHDGLKTVWESQQRWQAALNVLLVADLLVPIKSREAGAKSTGYFSIDRHRFSQSSKFALEAMSRQSFAPLDLATVLTFSQIHIRADMRPPATQVAASGDPSSGGDAAANVPTGLETITPWLDTSELFPGAWAADPSIWAPPPVAETRAG